MHVDIFIRTYKNDLPWLAYALKSIHKYVTGHRNIIVAIPMDQVRLLSHLSVEKVVGVHDLEDGYLGQQLTKMQAWKLTDADAVVFWDSDVVATRPVVSLTIQRVLSSVKKRRVRDIPPALPGTKPHDEQRTFHYPVWH